jgi:hypothetical protein
VAKKTHRSPWNNLLARHKSFWSGSFMDKKRIKLKVKAAVAVLARQFQDREEIKFYLKELAIALKEKIEDIENEEALEKDF